MNPLLAGTLTVARLPLPMANAVFPATPNRGRLPPEHPTPRLPRLSATPSLLLLSRTPASTPTLSISLKPVVLSVVLSLDPSPLVSLTPLDVALARLFLVVVPIVPLLDALLLLFCRLLLSRLLVRPRLMLPEELALLVLVLLSPRPLALLPPAPLILADLSEEFFFTIALLAEIARILPVTVRETGGTMSDSIRSKMEVLYKMFVSIWCAVPPSRPDPLEPVPTDALLLRDCDSVSLLLNALV